MTDLLRQARRLTVTDPETGRTWPIPAGAADDGGDGGDAGSETDADATGDAGDGGDTGDGDAGDDGGDDTGRAGGVEALRADLAAERSKRKEERDARRALESRLEEMQRENESDVERAAREAREATLTPAQRALRTVAVRDAARAAGFRDTSDAVAQVDLDAIDVEIGDNGEVEIDEDAAERLVAELAETKPYLLEDSRRISGPVRGGADTQSGDGTGTSSTPQDSFMAALRAKAGRT